MTDQSDTRWLEPGYGDVTSARRLGADVEVTFANGDLVHITPSRLGIQWPEFEVHVDPNEGLAVQLTTPTGESREISWVQIRGVTDPEFAQEMRRRDAEQARRIGLRLRALREDRGLTQKDLAALVDMSGPQLSKIEGGAQDLRVSTVQALLRAMGATFAEVSGPDALEVSQRAIRKRAETAGVGRDLIDRLFDSVPRQVVPRALSRAFGWDPTELADGVPNTPHLAGVSFKTTRSHLRDSSPLVHLGHVVSEVVRQRSEIGPYLGVPGDPGEIRAEVAAENVEITLEALLEWMWSRGIAVVPLIGRGGFCAAAWKVDDVPVVVLKETREPVVFWLFDLAHELGHIARDHLAAEGIVDVDALQPGDGSDDSNADKQERAANAFALELLLREPQQVLAEVRAATRGNYLRFKSSVATVANRNHISAGLLGMIAAHEMTDIGDPKDRWGSANNLAVADGAGRPVAVAALRRRLHPDEMPELDATLLDVAVLGGE